MKMEISMASDLPLGGPHLQVELTFQLRVGANVSSTLG